MTDLESEIARGMAAGIVLGLGAFSALVGAALVAVGWWNSRGKR